MIYKIYVGNYSKHIYFDMGYPLVVIDRSGLSRRIDGLTLDLIYLK